MTLAGNDTRLSELALQRADGRPHDVALRTFAVSDYDTCKPDARIIVNPPDELTECRRLLGRQLQRNSGNLWISH
jgi:hypothetical protein